MRLHICQNAQEINRKIATQIIALVKEKPSAVLGLATGSSPVGVYDQLILDHKQNHTSYHHVQTFNLDEYLGIDQKHPQSYYQFMKRHLFDHINIQSELIHMPNGILESDVDECHVYNKHLAKTAIDLQLLGLGSNGHIGFNEPGTAFDSTTHIIKLDPKTRKDNARFFDTIDDVPTHAITMGIKNIMAAKHIILIAMGSKKKDAVYQMVFGKINTDWPCSVLQNHPNVDVYLDSEAALLLKEKAVSY